jgi:hypothetical protein
MLHAEVLAGPVHLWLASMAADSFEMTDRLLFDFRTAYLRRGH